LPQFLNVPHGEMRVAGPRPHLIVHDTAFQEIAAS
jgi:lipopolysaccharide/colanic/teichoic acid biosynthesis glycosyltransferase